MVFDVKYVSSVNYGGSPLVAVCEAVFRDELSKALLVLVFISQ